MTVFSPPSPTQDAVQAALRSYLLSFLPSGSAFFTGAISGIVLTVSDLTQGSPLSVGDTVLGQGVASGTVVYGDNLDGTYAVSVSQTVPATLMYNGVEVVEAQDNRVPEPLGDFVTMTVLRRQRLATTNDIYVDCAFQGSVAADVLTVSSVVRGTIAVGRALLGPGVSPGTIVVGRLTGAGGVGTYRVWPAQAVSATRLATGVELLTQPTQVSIQLDIHSSSDQNSSDMAQTISTMVRDPRATSFFAALSGGAISPIHADDPRQMPFVNAEQQYETRYVVEAVLQANQTITATQEFMDLITVQVVPADSYPA